MPNEREKQYPCRNNGDSPVIHFQSPKCHRHYLALICHQKTQWITFSAWQLQTTVTKNRLAWRLLTQDLAIQHVDSISLLNRLDHYDVYSHRAVPSDYRPTSGRRKPMHPTTPRPSRHLGA
ncbi:hypothetical protein DBB29_01395 [Pandoraea cepalis]|uniref:Transposase n=1 Tax=Pandoraea cepalis TaxID=2508294 RepID=A0AAW7MIT9_9BURK|nr:hypothetical protein [Pandoraea cepalis]MDN4576781.1 hypothetical protein [Pandoraea cepalis]